MTPTATATAARSDPFGELALSEDELALLSDLAEEPPLASGPWGGAPDARGRRWIDGARLAETHARSILSARRALPALGGAWRWGAQSAFLLNDLVLATPRLVETWLRAAPGTVGRFGLTSHGDRTWTSGELGGLTRIETLSAELGADFALDTEAGLRSADRAVIAAADAAYGGERWALRVFGRGQHEEDLRVRDVGGGTRATSERGWRADGGAHLVVRPLEGLETNTRVAITYEDGQATPSLTRERLGVLAQGSALIGGPKLDGRLSGGYLLARSTPEGRTDTSWQVRVLARWQASDLLRFEAGAFVSLDETRSSSTSAGQRQLVGFGFAEFNGGRWYARAGARVAHLETTEEAREVIGLVAVLPRADLQVLVVGDPDSDISDVGEGLMLELRGGRGLQLAGGWDPQRARRLGGEDSWRVTAGPGLRLPGVTADLRGVLALVDTDLFSATMFGAELDVSTRLAEGLHCALALAWLEGADSQTGASALAIPNVRGHVAVRYTAEARRAYVEVRARAASPRWRVRGPPAPEPDPAYGFVRVGLAGGMDLGAGFRLEATVENALDDRTRDLTSREPAPGLDLRVALRWSPQR